MVLSRVRSRTTRRRRNGNNGMFSGSSGSADESGIADNNCSEHMMVHEVDLLCALLRLGDLYQCSSLKSE